MRIQNVPATDARYWTVILAASIFGANMGDFFSHVLHLGHYYGLPVLALAFGLVLRAERRWPAATEAYYWLAIVVLRTAATNLGDLATDDLKLSYPLVLAALAVLLAVLAAVNARGRTAGSAVPKTDGIYWAAMLAAGTLGTAGGDFMAKELGLGLVNASLILCAILAAVLAARRLPGGATAATYWLTIAVVRMAGTTIGDFFASRRGLGLGLPVSTPLTGLALLLLLLLWRSRQILGRPALGAPAEEKAA